MNPLFFWYQPIYSLNPHGSEKAIRRSELEIFSKKFHGRVEHSSFEKLTTKVAREQKNSTLLVRKSSQLSNKLVQIKIHSCSFSQLAAQISPKLKKKLP